MSDLPRLLFNTKTHNAVSMATNIAGVPVDITQAGFCSVQCTATGTPTGTITIEGSNDGANFGALDTIALTGAALTSIKNYTPGYIYIQARYTSTSGAGTLTVYITGKL